MEEKKRNGRKTCIARTGPSSESNSSDEADQHRMEQQRKLDDDQLLLDAGITLDDMGDEEKRQILEALRQSLPPAQDASPGGSDQASISAEDEGGAERLADLSEDPVTPVRSIKNKDSRERAELPEDPIPSAESSDDKDSKEDVEELPEDPMPPAQSLDVMSLNYDSEEEEDQECDSTTTSVTVPVTENRTSSVKSKPRERGQLLQTFWEVARQELSNDDSVSNTSNTSGALDTDLLTRTTKKLSEHQSQAMKLSTKQKQKGQSRFKELFSKTKLSQTHSSESSESPVEDGGSGNKGVPSSQDLFAEQASEDETDIATQPDCSNHDAASKTHSAFHTSVVTRSAPSPCIPSSPTQDGQSSPYSRGEGGEEKEGVYMDDETQPPEDYDVVEVEEEEDGVDEEPVLQQEADTQSQRSPVYPMQVTPASCSSPSANSKTNGDAHYLTPSKLPVDDPRDCRPLLHDNWFTWHPVSPVCCLHRTYRVSSRKRKEPASESKPYFCPEGKNVAAYSEVIVCMLDSYLQQFSAMQRCLHTFLPWGKPIRAGQHQPDSLDCKKKGQPTFNWDLSNGDDDGDDDFHDQQPPHKKLPASHRKHKASEDDTTADTDNAKVRMEAGVSEWDNQLTQKPGDGGDQENTAAYEAETQPLDSDSDLPDLYVEPSNAVDSSWNRKQPRQVKGRAQSPTQISEDSQSSSSLLNEQGELYSTQLPRRKRAGQTETDETATRSKRPRRAALTTRKEDSGRNSPEKSKPLRRKRKQVTSGDEDSNKVLVLNVNKEEGDEGEVSFPQMKKLQVRRKKMNYVHISSTVGDKEGRSTIVHPLHTEIQTEDRTVRVLPIRLVNDGKQLPQPSTSSNVSSTSDVRAGVGAEDSDDSVQYVDPASCPDPAPAPTVQSQQVGQDDRLEDGDHGAVAARPPPQEPTESADSRSDEELVTCPLCYKQFPSSVIERHASDCSLEMDREEPQIPDNSAAPIALPPASVLRRRPLRGQLDREEFVCGLCNAKQGGRGALERHYEMCRQKYQGEEASCSSKPDPPADRKRSAYKIPRKVEGAADFQRLPGKMLASVMEEEEVVTEESDSSGKDPPFRPAEEDKKQEEEDQKDDRRAVARQSKRPGLSRGQE